ncbi:MAG: fibronectin type III domain-containing protein, partial [Bacteroidota bacterium]
MRQKGNIEQLRKKIKQVTLVGVFLLGHISLFSQTFPVQSSLQLVPPYSLKLPDYVAPGSEKLVLNALLTDVSRGQLDVELRVLIEGQGIRIETNPNINPAPITLTQGINRRLTGLDMEPYFRAENLQFFGMGRQQFVNSGGALPEGIYRFCIDVVEANRNVSIASRSCGTAWLVLNDPPIVNLPKENEKLTPADPQFVRFQWTPRHTGSPNSAFTTEYTFQLVEVWPTGRNPNDAILTTTPIYETTTSATSLVYGPSEPALVRGRQYAFRIQAKSLDGIEQLNLFRNDGYTQVQSFIYGDACIVPPNISVEAASSRKLQVYWDADPVHSGFLVKYRKQGATDWVEERILFSGHTLEGLQPDTPYEVQVLGVCGFSSSEVSQTFQTKTQAEIVGDFSCGSPPADFNLNNTTPLPSLNRGDVIKAGDFDVSVIDVSGGNGTFSGTGQLVVPMMNNVKAGTAFTNIKVNDEYRMYEGDMHFTGVTVQALPDEVLDEIDGFYEELAELEEDLNEVLDASDEVVKKIDSIVNEIQEIKVFEKEEYEELVSEETTIRDLQEEVKEALSEAAGAVQGGNIVEAAKQVAKARTLGKRIKAKKEQAAHTDTVQVVAVRFTSGGSGYDLGPGHNGIEPNYYKIMTDQGDEYGPWFSAAAGQAFDITAEWVSDSRVPKEEITFTLDDQEVGATGTASGWELRIPSGSADEKRVLKAIHEGNTVGIAAVAVYNNVARKVTLVQVNGAEMPSASEARDYLNDVYGSAIVDWEVATAEVTIDDSWDLNSNGNLYIEENNDLSTYPDEVKALNSAVKAALNEVDKDRYYVLFTNIPNSSNVVGFMPRKKQFGLVFDGRRSTLAHELGHGAFRLSHTWVEFPNLSEGQTQNLMDYGGGKNLRQYQWDQIHNPKWIITLFDDEEEGVYMVSDTIMVSWFIEELTVELMNIMAQGDEPLQSIGLVNTSNSTLIIDNVGNRWIVDSEGNVTPGAGNVGIEDVVSDGEVEKDKGYYITAGSDTTKYNVGDELVYIKHKSKVKLMVGSEKDTLKVTDLKWEVDGKEICKGKGECEFDLSKDGSYKIKVFVGADKVLNLNLDVYKKPVIKFDRDGNYKGEYGFDAAKQTELQKAKDYDSHKFQVEGTYYYTPWLTFRNGQMIILDYKVDDLEKL